MRVWSSAADHFAFFGGPFGCFVPFLAGTRDASEGMRFSLFWEFCVAIDIVKECSAVDYMKSPATKRDKQPNALVV